MYGIFSIFTQVSHLGKLSEVKEVITPYGRSLRAEPKVAGAKRKGKAQQPHSPGQRPGLLIRLRKPTSHHRKISLPFCVIFCYPIVTERELLEFLFPICFF